MKRLFKKKWSLTVLYYLYISGVVVLVMKLWHWIQVLVVGPGTKPVRQQPSNSKFD